MLFRWNKFRACVRATHTHARRHEHKMVKTKNDTMKAFVIHMVNVIVAVAVFNNVNQIIHMFTTLWESFWVWAPSHSLGNFERVCLIRRNISFFVCLTCIHCTMRELEIIKFLSTFLFFSFLPFYTMIYNDILNLEELPKKEVKEGEIELANDMAQTDCCQTAFAIKKCTMNFFSYTDPISHIPYLVIAQNFKPKKIFYQKVPSRSYHGI